jgi:hypothetical protein
LLTSRVYLEIRMSLMSCFIRHNQRDFALISVRKSCINFIEGILSILNLDNHDFIYYFKGPIFFPNSKNLSNLLKTHYQLMISYTFTFYIIFINFFLSILNLENHDFIYYFTGPIFFPNSTNLSNLLKTHYQLVISYTFIF